MKSTITPHAVLKSNSASRLAMFFLFLVIFSTSAVAQTNQKRERDRETAKVNAKDTDTWSAEEYSGLRGEKEVSIALLSKAFTWLTGSPADNEKLSIGKNAQFFGFVALRYQSGRAASRGTLGRAMFTLANDEQRDIMAKAVLNEKEPLEAWWASREEILRLLEEHLYTGLPINEAKLFELGEEFSLLNSDVSINEAHAYAAFENSMSEEQRQYITAWRSDPETAREYFDGDSISDNRVDSDELKLLEDLYAKCFSWISGQREDTEIIPIGQPAQFFGFVSIRHKSGHAANRGDIARTFNKILNSEQRAFIDQAVDDQLGIVREFLVLRHLYLNELEGLRSEPTNFDQQRADEFARKMGRLEMQIAMIEAQAYRKIRVSMSDEQTELAMEARGDYIIDESEVEMISMLERGEKLSLLCAGCHAQQGEWRPGMIGPALDNFWDRPIASDSRFDYSNALAMINSEGEAMWTPKLLDDFLANPKSFAPGTKMDFQGLLNPDDREAIIEYFKVNR